MIKILILFVLLGLAFGAYSGSKIYKYTDESGRVFYTDKKPFDDSKEEKIKKLSVFKSTEVKPSENRRRTEQKQKQADKLFDNFVLLTPKQDSSIWGTGGNVFVSVNVNGKLPSNYRIKFYIDGVARGKVKSNSQLIADVGLGEHTVYAEVLNANSRTVIKTSPVVTFYLKLNTTNNSRQPQNRSLNQRRIRR